MGQRPQCRAQTRVAKDVIKAMIGWLCKAKDLQILWSWWDCESLQRSTPPMARTHHSQALPAARC